jgi:hypothetical protein
MIHTVGIYLCLFVPVCVCARTCVCKIKERGGREGERFNDVMDFKERRNNSYYFSAFLCLTKFRHNKMNLMVDAFYFCFADREIWWRSCKTDSLSIVSYFPSNKSDLNTVEIVRNGINFNVMLQTHNVGHGFE